MASSSATTSETVSQYFYVVVWHETFDAILNQYSTADEAESLDGVDLHATGFGRTVTNRRDLCNEITQRASDAIATFPCNVHWAAVLEFGGLPDQQREEGHNHVHPHLNIVLHLERKTRMSTVKARFVEFFPDEYGVEIRTIYNILKLMTYMLKECGAIVVRSWANVDIDEIQTNTNRGGKETFNQLVADYVANHKDLPISEIRVNMQRLYPSRFDGPVFNKIANNVYNVDDHEIVTDNNRRTNPNCSLNLIAWVHLQNDPVYILKQFAKYTRRRSTEDRGSMMLFGVPGTGKSWSLKWLSSGDMAYLNLTCTGSGKFQPIRTCKGVCVIDEMPKNMTEWQKDQAATLLQILEGDSTTVKEPGVLNAVHCPPWIVITSNYWTENNISGELKRRITCCECNPNLKKGDFPYSTYNNLMVWRYFAIGYEDLLSTPIKYPCCCVMFRNDYCGSYSQWGNRRMRDDDCASQCEFFRSKVNEYITTGAIDIDWDSLICNTQATSRPVDIDRTAAVDLGEYI